MQEEIEDWDGIERRHTCQGCSAIYAKLLRSEKFNLEGHKELYKLNYQKVSKKSFYFLIVVMAFAFILSFKFRSDFELRYIDSLEQSNKELQSVIFGLNDLIDNIDTINKKIIYSEEDLKNKIKAIQSEVNTTKKAIEKLQSNTRRKP